MRAMKDNKGRGGQLFDRLLISRLAKYGQNHDLKDIDDCITYLKSTHKEYQRQKAAPFRIQVSRAVAQLLKSEIDSDNSDSEQVRSPATQTFTQLSPYRCLFFLSILLD